ncbi:ATP-binding protein [Mitsuokella multacida]|uniref:ATP-binding protein n=1 Tax=Mitsuokella multacida TaxID=52226 RepID=UPI003F60BC7F
MLFRIVSGSYERKSLILTMNLACSKWVNVFTNEQMAAAMIDRMPYHDYLLMELPDGTCSHAAGYRNKLCLLTRPAESWEFLG